MPRDSRRLRVARRLLGDSGVRPWKRLQGFSARCRTLLGHFFQRIFKRLPGDSGASESPASVGSDQSVRGMSEKKTQKDFPETPDVKRLPGDSGRHHMVPSVPGVSGATTFPGVSVESP